MALLDHLGHRLGPHRRRVDGRDDRPDDGHRAPRAGAHPHVDHVDDGRAGVGQPTPEALAILLQPAGTTRDEVIEAGVAATKVIAGPAHFDEDEARRRAAEAYDRCFNPDGVGRQLLAIVASGSRAEGLAALDVPTLVIHGDVDPLVTPSGGQRTAELIPGAELLMIEGMGHDLPPAVLGQVVETITALASRTHA